VILSTEGEGKGFTQEKYERQILRGLLGDICKEKNGRYIGDFCAGEDYFIVEDGSKVRKGVVRSHEHPPCSAFTRVGNLWGEFSKLEFVIGPSAHRLAGGCS